jgi:integrase
VDLTGRTAGKVRDGITFHSLRHASATEQLAAGIGPVDVAARLGHASTRTTLDTYAHALPAGDVKVASDMGALLPS